MCEENHLQIIFNFTRFIQCQHSIFTSVLFPNREVTIKHYNLDRPLPVFGRKHNTRFVDNSKKLIEYVNRSIYSSTFGEEKHIQRYELKFGRKRISQITQKRNYKNHKNASQNLEGRNLGSGTELHHPFLAQFDLLVKTTFFLTLFRNR